MQKCFFAKCVNMGAKFIPMLFIFVTAFLFSGCAEAIIGCKDGDLLLFFSPVRDFACPEEPPNAVNNVQIVPNADTRSQVILEWNNPAQIDLRAIEVRWTKVTETIPEPQTIRNIEGAIDTTSSSSGNGIARIPNARPNERMQQAFIVELGFAYRFRIASIDSHNNMSLVQQTHYIPAPTNVSAAFQTEGMQQHVVRLTWTAIDGVTEYYVYRAIDNSDFNRRVPQPPTPITDNSYMDSVNLERNYRYRIRAVIRNEDGTSTESVDSVSAGISIPSAPAMPQGFSAAGQDGAVKLTWQSSVGADSYRIYRAAGNSISGATRLPTTISTTITGTNYTDQSAENDTEYTYTVRAVNTSGIESENSNTATATPRATLDAPTALMADAGNGQVSLSWMAPADGATVTQYYIYRATGNSISGAPRLPSTISATITGTSYTDQSAENGTQYSYAVRAVNANGTESADSNTDTATPLATPGIPSNLTANAGDGEVMLSWNAPAPVVGGPVAEYYIYRATGNSISGATRLFRTDPVTNNPVVIITTTYTDQSAENGIQYTYAVRAVNANGVASADSNPDTATPLAAPNAPTNLTATGRDGEVVLSWMAPVDGTAVAQYYIYRAIGSSISGAPRLPRTISATITGMSYTDSSANDGTQYTYAVRAVNVNGTESADSNTDTATPLATPGVPANLTAAAKDDYVMLNWNAPARGGPVTQYYIYRATGTHISSATRLSPPPTITDTSYTDRSADNGIQYIYFVRAVNANGTQSENSNTATATPLDAPNAPINLTATGRDGEVVLSWMAPTGGTAVTQYYIYRVAGNSISGATRLPSTISATITGITYTDSSANDGTQYTYAVRAVNVNGTESADSNPDTATPLAAPNAPTNFTATGRDDEVVLSWTAPADGTPVLQYYIYRVAGNSIRGATRPRNTTSVTITGTSYTDQSAENDTEYTYAVRAVNANGTESENSNSDTATPRAPTDMPNSLDADAGNMSVTLTWTAPTSGGTVSNYRIYRAIGGDALTRLVTTPTTLPSGRRTYTDSGLTNGTAYRYVVRAVNANGVESADSPSASATPRSIDSDGDTLIDIRNLDMLYNIRYNLAGTSYKSSAVDSGVLCGTNGTIACTGYELMQNLDFSAASSYASGSVNMDWRPTGGTPSSATNSGWQPIGDNSARFTTLFEGNGRSISNLYGRDTTGRGTGGTGLFGYLGTGGTLRNLLIENGNLYGGSSRDYIGMAAGLNNGTIANVAVRGGSAHGGGGDDFIGGLVGWSSGSTIIASSSTADVYGDDGVGDNVGGLVGVLNVTPITASYASGIVDGGRGNDDRVGGLVGNNSGGSAIRASYAISDVNANAGNDEEAGGLVGMQSFGSITASYANGTVDGGAGTGDSVGQLLGHTMSVPVTASYGFGTTSGGETAGNNGTTPPSGVTMVTQLTAPGSASTTAAPSSWNQATSHTLNAWDFGTNAQAPALRYADYDGSGGTDYCALFTNVPGTSTAITCGTTLLPGQR